MMRSRTLVHDHMVRTKSPCLVTDVHHGHFLHGAAGLYSVLIRLLESRRIGARPVKADTRLLDQNYINLHGEARKILQPVVVYGS